MNTISRKPNRGFTLIEALFAILIFSAALVSLLAISSKGIAATEQVKNETTAYYLAQEGLEVARNGRDTSFVQMAHGATGLAWTDSFAKTPSDCTNPVTPCYVDYQGGLSVPILVQGSGPASYDVFQTASNQFSNQGVTPSGFSRTVEVLPTASPDEYTALSKVAWTSKGVTRSVSLRTLLKRWQ